MQAKKSKKETVLWFSPAKLRVRSNTTHSHGVLAEQDILGKTAQRFNPHVLLPPVCVATILELHSYVADLFLLSTYVFSHVSISPSRSCLSVLQIVVS